ncbi:MAG: patatin-like phospholipase family protein [Blastocatellales bacterium]|nr:patatin-like phospholipase family protein [Blastocatellales bacterium]
MKTPVLLLLAFAFSFPLIARSHAQTTAQLPHKRLKIGLALSGGGARGVAHVGVLKWCEEHRIPVDYIAGTSMGGLIGGLYSIGVSPEELRSLLININWSEALSSGPSFSQLSFRRKEDRRDFQSDVELGLRGGVSLPAGLSSAHFIGLLIDRLTLPYSQIEDFDQLPIPFRCLATDFLNAQPLLLSNGSLATALRATMAIPGVFPPVEREGLVLVDGGLLNNIPTQALRGLGPDVLIAVDVGARLGDLQSIASFSGILQQSITVMTIDNERRSLRLADIVIAPELGEMNTLDFSQIERAADIGYEAAEAKSAILSRFSLDEDSWNRYLDERRARTRLTIPVPEAVRIEGVDARAQQSIRRQLEGYAGQPLDAIRLEADLSKVLGEGRYASLDYRFAPNSSPGAANTLLIHARAKTHAPPTVNFKVEIDGSDVNDINFTLGARATYFDLGGYGAEWRNDLTIGFRTQMFTEYFRPLSRTSAGGLFVAPCAYYIRDRQNLYVPGGGRAAEYQGNRVGAGVDFGYLTRRSELRAGYEIGHQDTRVRIGLPILPTVDGTVSEARVRWTFDAQDSATIPTRGLRLRSEVRYYFDAPGAARGFAQAETGLSYFHPASSRGSAFFAGSAGTSFDRDSAPFQQFRLGGPFRLGAYNRDEFRGNHYALASAGYLHRISQLPPLLGGSVNAVGWIDAGDAFTLRAAADLRLAASLGFVLDTRLGPLSFIGSYGEGGRGKLYFSFGRFF